MPIFNNILAGSSGQGDTGYDIDQSLRFNNPDGAYLTFTPSSTATSTKIFTFSGWVKRGQVDQERRIFTAGEAGSTPRTDFTFGSTGALSIGVNPAGSAWYMATTTALYRDPSAWYHIVWSMDTSQATPANRSALYINGEQVTDFSSNTLNDSTAIPQDSTVLIGQSGMLQAVGGYANNLAQSAYDGYLAEVHFIDGQKLTPASFGETNSATNQWVPIEVTGMTYGTNGFYQKYSATELANSFTDSALGALKLSTQTAAMWTNSGMAQFNASVWADPGSGTSAVLSDTTGAGSAIGSTLTCDFGSGNEKRLGKLEVYFQNTNIYCSWKMQYSSDDSTWTDVSNPSPSTLGGTPGAAGTLSMTWDVPSTAYRYWRLYKTNSPTSGSWQEWNKLYEWDDNEPKHTITANGDVANSRAQAKIGESSIKFDGSGDYLSCADSSDWDFLPASGYTAEAWYKPITHAGTDFIIGQSADGNNYWMLGHEDGAGLRFESYSGGSLVLNITGGEITDTDWHHIAVVRDGSDVEIFKDGTSVATGTTSSTATFSGQLRIGEGSAHGAMDGYLDEIRLSNTARYTSSFTPSTTAFTADSNTLLLIHSDFNGGLGADSSGNENDFSVTNLVATDQVLDSPTNNFTTFNSVCKDSNAVLSEGNLKIIGSAHLGASVGTIGASAGKWYWEMVVVTSVGGYIGTGIAKETTTDDIDSLWAGGPDSIS